MNNVTNETAAPCRGTCPTTSVPRAVARATAGVVAATSGCAFAVMGLYALAAYTHPKPMVSLAGLGAIYIAYIAALRLVLRPRQGPEKRRAVGPPDPGP